MIARLVALAILDGVALGAGWVIPDATGWALAAHAGLSAGAWALWLRGGGAIGFAPAILGLLGPGAVLLSLSLRGLRWRRATGPAFGVRPPDPRRSGARLAVARMLDGRVHHSSAETSRSLVTIMRHGDVGARRSALETVVRSFQPALSPVVALALTDADQTIRALAAAASARVVQNLASARAALEARCDTDPEATPALAALLAEHARANVLLSDSQRAHLRDDAVALRSGTATQIEALWAARDYAAIDRMAEAGRADAWWRAESAT